MAVSLKHNFQSLKADGTDTSLIQPSYWNAEHTLTLVTSRLLGRTTATPSPGPAEEISVGTGLTLASGSLSLTGAPTGSLVGTSDTQTLTNKTLTNPNLTGYTETVFTITDGASVSLSPNNGTIQIWTLGANRTPSAGTWANGQSITLMIADGTAYSVTWTTVAVTWVGGTAPTLPTTGYGVIQLWKSGNVIYGASVGNVA